MYIMIAKEIGPVRISLFDETYWHVININEPL